MALKAVEACDEGPPELPVEVGHALRLHGRTMGRLSDMMNIRGRPPEVAGRAVPVQWERDLVRGKGASAIATLVERSSRLVLLAKLDAIATEFRNGRPRQTLEFMTPAEKYTETVALTP